MPMVRRVYGHDARGGMGDAVSGAHEEVEPLDRTPIPTADGATRLDCDTRLVASSFARARTKMAGVPA